MPQQEKPLAGKDLAMNSIIENAWLYCEAGKIKAFGKMEMLAETGYQNHNGEIIDAIGRVVLPSFVDSHTHLVFAKSREEEFVHRIKGMSYEEISNLGGGILNSARRLQEANEDELFESAHTRLMQCIRWGTGAIEIKSGYGLTVSDELKMLRVVRRLKEVSPIAIKATFLGAHAFPMEYKENHDDYLKLIIDEMLPKVAVDRLADYVDVFCDRGFFSPEETEMILKAAAKYGLKPKIHANELGLTGGVQVGVKCNAISVDHLEHTSDAEIESLKNSNTIPTLLPSTAFFLGIPYPDARSMIAANLPVCLASDYNPGSSPSGRMAFVWSLACLRMKMLPIEAFHALTINGAFALELQNELGSISEGKLANLIITKPIPSLDYIPYHFSEDVFEKIIMDGKPFNR